MADTPENPKMVGSNCVDCRPQAGPCPIGCNQCFYNRPGAFYCDIYESQIPDPKDVGDRIVRMNSGHDSNISRTRVIQIAQRYERFFFNTSIPNFGFPGPVVFTANAKEEEPAWCPVLDSASLVQMDAREMRYRIIPSTQNLFLDRLMFVRLRVSPTNLQYIRSAVAAWTDLHIPVVLTFMAYYDQDPPGCRRTTNLEFDEFEWRDPHDNRDIPELEKNIVAYTWRIRTVNSYWCATPAFIRYVVHKMKDLGGTLVTVCGTPDSGKCKDCRNCETYHTQRAKHLAEKGVDVPSIM